MEALAGRREMLREELILSVDVMETLLTQDIVAHEQLLGRFNLMLDVYDQLSKADNEYLELMVAKNVSKEERVAELQKITDMKIRVEIIKVKVAAVKAATPSSTKGTVSISGDNNNTGPRLPKIEIKKFDGNFLEWLRFWAQFKEIDANPNLSGSAKFTYLMMSLKEGSPAYQTVAAFPQDDANYSFAIGALKRRFGEEDFLLQVYVRELLTLVISNANSKEKPPLAELFPKVDSHLRALKTLNLKSAEPETWLYPLVESCLPEETLRAWQRSPYIKADGALENPPKTRLDFMMEFLEKEVEISTRIDLARGGFSDKSTNKPSKRKLDTGNDASKKYGNSNKFNGPTVSFQNIDSNGSGRFEQPSRQVSQRSWKRRNDRSRRGNWKPYNRSWTKPDSAVGTTGAAKKQLCIFCKKGSHNAQDCQSAKSLSPEERKTIVKESQCCFRCLGNHYAHECQTDVQCQICGHRRHCAILCDQQGYENRSLTHRNDVVAVTHSKSNQVCSSPVALLTLQATLIYNDERKIVRIFIDPGSQRTYLRKDIARAMKMKKIGQEVVTHELFGGKLSKKVTHSIYEVKLVRYDNSGDAYCIMHVRDQDVISSSLPKLPNLTNAEGEELTQLGINLTDVGVGASPIDVLIGADNFGRILIGNIHALKNGQVAIETKLGWGLLGEKSSAFLETFGACQTTNMMSVSDFSISQLWDLDTIAVRDCTDTKTKKEENDEAKELFLNSLSRDHERRYVVGLPWRVGHPPLPTNRQLAEKSLERTTRKLKELGLFDFYANLFKEWEAEGFVEVVSEEGQSDTIHYIPHRPVVKPESTSTPVRPVFNASCRAGKSPSLNDCLYKGSNFILLIPDILVRFRQKKIGFVSDIRKAFQMIGVQESDRDVMRFLWWNANGTVKVLRHRRVMFGANCSPFILAAVLEYHLTHLEEHQEEGKRLLNSMYVDNCVSSESTVEDYLKFRKISTSLLAECKMDLRLWMSNVDEFEDSTTHTTSVLGMKWDRVNDVLFVKTTDIHMPAVISKRNVLSTCQKIFDPVGVTCPAVIPMKLLLQQTWILKLKWDENLPEDTAAKFQRWINEVKLLSNIRIPRRMTELEGESCSWTLHTFADSSTVAYAAVCYLKVVNAENVTVRLVGARSRVAPVKMMTIPRLELLACLIAVRLCNSIKLALGLEEIKTRFHTDSTTALAWIKRDEQWGTYVGNRTREINQLSDKEDWAHVPGSHNPADLPSRGCSPSQLLESHWWEGPSWLYTSDKVSLRDDEVAENEDEICKEIKKSANKSTIVAMSVLHLSECGASHSFSSWIRVMIYVKRFIYNLRHPEKKRTGLFSLEEIRDAEEAVVRDIQADYFSDWENRRFPGLQVKMNEKGILCVETRLLERKDLVYSTQPYLLPANHTVVKRMIMDAHLAYCHAGVGFLMTKLRRQFWIIRTRKSIYNVISKCLSCRKLNSKPFSPPIAQLPLDRIKNASVFEVVGIDLAGPFVLRNGKKTWMVIITCAVFRAVYLDLVDSLSTLAFIKCLRKFVERYGRPAIIYSDNGTNFRGCSSLFKKLDWKQVAEEEDTLQPIVWKFNPPGSPWWGGFWERLIRTIKDLLRRTVGKSSLNRKELERTLKVIEEVMNDRPLTYVSEKSGDLQPLTPNCFLHPEKRFKLPEADFMEGERFRKRYEIMTTMWKDLKKRFEEEYLAMLVACQRKKSSREPKVGELVVVSDDIKKRVEWPLGRIEELIAGRDGVVRVAKVRVREGRGFDTKIVTRAIQRLHPLELDRDVEAHQMVTRSKSLRM